MQELKNKVAAITGGNSGIGLSIAQKFKENSADVAILGRNQKTLSEAASHLKNILAVQGDVSKIADLDRFYQEIHKKFGKIDVLVASAGIAELRHLKDVDEKFFDEIVNINFKGLFFSVQRALPYLNDHASVILISSVAAHIGIPSHSVYSSTKAAVSHLAHCFSGDLIERGIRVNAISPGFVDTPIFDKMKLQDPHALEKRGKLVPMKRFAKPEEIAEAALFLASPRSSYIVGADLVVDGGLKAIFSFNVE